VLEVNPRLTWVASVAAPEVPTNDEERDSTDIHRQDADDQGRHLVAKPLTQGAERREHEDAPRVTIVHPIT
jgi:hypothetical protein